MSAHRRGVEAHPSGGYMVVFSVNRSAVVHDAEVRARTIRGANRKADRFVKRMDKAEKAGRVATRKLAIRKLGK